MSEVWRAIDLELGRRVAVKLLAPNADTARFEREARAFAALAHPNVTRLYDYGESAGRPFMVLEYLSGGSLEQLLGEQGVLSDGESRRVASEIAAGLAHAHARGLVHRDLKPANVLFDDEKRAKLADFGIARLAAGAGTLTEAGTVLGTAAYISPEQALGLTATPASDVYSFGVVLFRMLTGRLPFESADPFTLVAAHRDTPPPLVSEVRPDVPAGLAAAVDAALAKDPAARPADGAALLNLLTSTATPTALADGAITRVIAPGRAPRRRGRFATTLAGVLLVLLASAGAVLAYEITRPAKQPVRGGVLGIASTLHRHRHPTLQQVTSPQPVVAVATTRRHTTTGAPTTKPTRKNSTTAATASHAATTTSPTNSPTTGATTTTYPATTSSTATTSATTTLPAETTTVPTTTTTPPGTTVTTGTTTTSPVATTTG